MQSHTVPGVHGRAGAEERVSLHRLEVAGPGVRHRMSDAPPGLAGLCTFPGRHLGPPDPSCPLPGPLCFAVYHVTSTVRPASPGGGQGRTQAVLPVCGGETLPVRPEGGRAPLVLTAGKVRLHTGPAGLSAEQGPLGTAAPPPKAWRRPCRSSVLNEALTCHCCHRNSPAGLGLPSARWIRKPAADSSAHLGSAL